MMIKYGLRIRDLAKQDKMTKPITLLIIALILFFLILGTFFFFLYKDGSQSMQPQPVQLFTTPLITPTTLPTPTALPTPTPSPAANELLIKQQLIDVMPIQTAEFNIEYFSNADMFIVTIKESPYEQNRLKSEQWFKDRGITNFQSLNIRWSSLRNVQ